MRQTPIVAFTVAAIAAAAPAAAPAAESARDTLMRAAFATTDKAQALALIDEALARTRAVLDRTPDDREALLQNALATGYRGQLKRSPGDAKATRTMIEALARRYPRDAEIEVALAGWHLTAVSELGGLLARTVLGASKDTGFVMLGRALALGGDRAFFPGYAALIRLRLDPRDWRAALALAERAAGGTTPTAADRAMQRAAQRILVPLRAGDGAAAAALARRLLPFGMTR